MDIVYPARFIAHSRDEIEQRLAAVTPGQHAVRPLGEQFEASILMARLPRMSIFSVQMNAAQIVQCERHPVYGIFLPLLSQLQFRDGHVLRECPTAHVYVRRPRQELNLRMPERTPVLVTYLFTSLLDDIKAQLGRAFRPRTVVSLSTAEGKTFQRYLQFVFGEIKHGAPFLRSPLATAELEHTLGMLFVAAAECMDRRRRAVVTAVAPRYLAQAEEYIRANLGEPLSVLDVAAAAGVSPRTLSSAFRKHRGTTTNAFVRARRLEAVQRDLLDAAPGNAKVTDIAIRYGFTHLGHFVNHYRNTFGETPSQTLKG